MHHQVTDLRGFVDFLEVWAQIARGEIPDCSKIPDDWSHTPGRFFAAATSSDVSMPTPPPPFAVLPAPLDALPSLPPSAITRWKFTPDAVARLKCDLSPSHSAMHGLWISSGDALCALLWGAVARARDTANVSRQQVSGDDQTEVLALAADGRGRAPQGDIGGRYFGNLNALCAAKAPRLDLLSATSGSASRVALGIRNALNVQLAPEAVASKISFFEDPANTEPPGRIVFAADVVGTNWCQAHLESTKFDFGWGKPFAATSGGGPLPAGFFRLLQGVDSGDITVTLTIEEEAAHALKRDVLLNQYADLVSG